MITEFKIFENKLFNEFVRMKDEFGIVMEKFMENFFENQLEEYNMKVSLLNPNSASLILRMEGETDLNPILNVYLSNYAKRVSKNLREQVYKLQISRRYTTNDTFNSKLKEFEKYINSLIMIENDIIHITINYEKKISIDELREVISKLNMEEYELFQDVNKYNL
jgi:hypothetical protein